MAHSALLKKVLKPPSAVANALDWKKAPGGVATAMTIDIHADRIGLALTTLRSEKEYIRNIGHDLEYAHNASTEGHNFSSCTLLDSISLKNGISSSEQKKRRRGIVSSEAKQRLNGLIHDHNVCGFVVSWPLQQDTGLMGAACGRTLWTLEQLLDGDDNIVSTTPQGSLFASSQRPLCLWDGAPKEHHRADAFGRSTVFARTSTKKEHVASKEQYHQDESILAAEVWKDFCNHHWPTVNWKEDANASMELPSEETVRIPESSVQAKAHLVRSRCGSGNFRAVRRNKLVAVA